MEQPELQFETVNEDNRELIQETFGSWPAQDVADAIDAFRPDDALEAMALVEPDQRAEVFSYLAPQRQMELLSGLPMDRSRDILSDLKPDDLTALLEHLPAEMVERLLKLLRPVAVQQALRLLGYPEESVGRLMTPRYVSVRPDWTVARALDHMRAAGNEGETMNVIFITDGSGHLHGVVPLKRFVLSEPATPVGELMSENLISIPAAADREEAVRVMQHYDINVLPVVEKDGVLLGIVTVDDVMDVAEQEATEDFHKMGSVGALDLSLAAARPSLLYRKRVGWLVLLVFMNIFGGAAIAYFEDVITAVVALVFFLPLIVDSGGNAGSQAATLMVRALATGDVEMRDWLRLLGKELGVAAALGLTMGLAVWGLGIWRGGPEVGMAVALAMVCVVIVGSMVGMLLPFLLTRLKLDPATASAPLITSIADISGIMIYFTIATAVLGLHEAV